MVREKFGQIRSLMSIVIGVAIYTFGFVKFNTVNALAEGGVTGVTSIAHAPYGINPAYSSLILNVSLFTLGARIFGRKSLALAIYGTVPMSWFIWFWQRVPIQIVLENDMMLVAVVAGLFSGVGSGSVFRYGVTTGGADIIGCITEEKFGLKFGQTLLFVDIVAPTTSLVYIDLQHMFYTLVASFVYSQVPTIVQNGGYTARGMTIITQESEEAAQTTSNDINRGVTYLSDQGVYPRNERNTLHMALNPGEVHDVKAITADLDPDAFILIIDVDEVVSSDFKTR